MSHENDYKNRGWNLGHMRRIIKTKGSPFPKNKNHKKYKNRTLSPITFLFTEAHGKS